ncbi:MAG: hypothetical protein Kow00108_02550 [Calditrichia bacterium]
MKVFLNINAPVSDSEKKLIRYLFIINGLFVETTPGNLPECSLVIHYGDANISDGLWQKVPYHIVIPFEIPEITNYKSSKLVMLYDELHDGNVPVISSLVNQLRMTLTGENILDWPVVHLIDDSPAVLEWKIDIPGNCLFHLNRYEEMQYQRFHPSLSLLSEFLMNPVVDLLMDAFMRSIKAFAIRHTIPLLIRRRWIKGKSVALLSHDVDLTRKWGPKSFLTKGIPSLLSGNFNKFKEAVSETFTLGNSYWTFPELLTLYKERNIRATFFFIARPWENLSYRYDIHRGIFRLLFKEMISEGHEVALHSSRYSFGKRDMVLQEKIRLEKAAGIEIGGIRQHFLNLKFPDAFTFFGNLQFDYDSSMGYNERMGFRSGIANPYRVNQDNGVNIFEIPFSVMDYHIQNLTQVDKIYSIISMIKRLKGVFSFLLHPSNLAEEPYRTVFITIVNELEESDQFVFMTHQELVHYIKQWENVQLTPIDSGTLVGNSYKIDGAEEVLKNTHFELIANIEIRSDHYKPNILEKTDNQIIFELRDYTFGY